MKIARKTFATVLGLALLVGFASRVDAIPFTYNYQSAVYVDVGGAYLDEVDPSLSGTFTIDVADNTDLASIERSGDLTAVEFSDGINTVGLGDVVSFIFGTDSNGDIVIDDLLHIEFAIGGSGFLIIDFDDTPNVNDVLILGPGDEDTAEAVEVGSFSQASVPEPGLLALLGVGLVGIALIRRRRSVRYASV